MWEDFPPIKQTRVASLGIGAVTETATETASAKVAYYFFVAEQS